MNDHSKINRSKIMAAIHSKNTKPELTIRSMLHRLGFRFRIHYKKLPGTPDIVFPKYNAVIQINGCFWHGHNCPIFKVPKTRTNFWQQKVNKNRMRDKKKPRSITGKRLAINDHMGMRHSRQTETQS